MNWFRKSLILVAAAASCSSALGAKKEDGASKPDKTEKKKGKKKGDEELKSVAPEAAEASRQKISVPVPPGHDAKGLVIPYRNAEGKMQMRFTMEIGARTDPDHMAMTTLLIETFDEDGKGEMTIDLPKSVLDLNTSVISTESGAVIKRADFELSGKKMEFNTETKTGRLAGNVRMLIYNLDNENNSTPEEKAGAK